MQIEITGQHLELTPALKEHVEQKLAHIQSHFDKITNAHVVLIVDKQTQTAEAELLLPGHTICAKASSHDMYHSIDDMAHKLLAQVDKYKDKLKDHH